MEKDYLKILVKLYDEIENCPEKFKPEMQKDYANIMLRYLKYAVQYCKEIIEK